MFNLDDAIAGWRRRMVAGGIKSPEALDELVSHLRDDIDQQMRAGIIGEQAFIAAAQRIGRASALKLEFKKVAQRPRAGGKLMSGVCISFIGFIAWLAGYTFLQMGLSVGEQIVAFGAVASSLLVACGWRYAVPFLPVIANPRKRIAIGLACIVSGPLCASFYCNIILPHFEHSGDPQIPAIGFWALFPIAVLATLGLGLMMSEQDREHWGMGKPCREKTATDGS